ncbi:hypothetical protein BH11PAT4_BH11PAT4_4210 [soil metagenome]
MKSTLFALKKYRYLTIAMVYLAGTGIAAHSLSSRRPAQVGEVLGITEEQAAAFKDEFPSRDLAIEAAIKAGSKTYKYTTSFIPGIGMAGQLAGNQP